jgi:hypothetical protein
MMDEITEARKASDYRHAARRINSCGRELVLRFGRRGDCSMVRALRYGIKQGEENKTCEETADMRLPRHGGALGPD